MDTSSTSQEKKPSCITLTTDFGLMDGYVAAIKGVILARAPEVTIVDLCHAVPPQDIAQAAYLLHETAFYFPVGSIHVVVVDPGVGSSREIILLVSQGHSFLAPDNGVVSLLITPGCRAFRVARPDLYLSPLSHTFHGRDIFAPLAAHLARGHAPESMGQAVATADLAPLHLPHPHVDPIRGTIRGCVIRRDHFGNLITNITLADLGQLQTERAAITLAIGPHRLRNWHDTYSQVAQGEPLLLINSAGLVEIAVNRGDAANYLNSRIYAPVLLSVC